MQEPEEMEDTIVKSPDGKHSVNLHFVGQIQDWGPKYFQLSINAEPLPLHIFGDEVVWSPDSRFLAAEEWLTTEYTDGPMTRVAIFDVSEHKVCCLRKVPGGLVGKFAFDEEILLYRKFFNSEGRVEDASVDVSRLDDWRDILYMEDR